MYDASNPPEVCHDGHQLGPNRVLVDAPRCSCDKAQHRGHTSWTCRVCGDVTYSDGHDDDTKLMFPPPKFVEALRIED